MILILDDTFSSRHKYNDVSYLNDEKYKRVCNIIETPTKKDFRNIINGIENIQLLCNHRSLKLFNDVKEVIDGKEAIQNLFTQVQSQHITRLEFGRDMHPNFKAKTLNKDIFYQNLKPFLDHYINKEQIELKILFYGRNYAEQEYLETIDKMIDEINFTEIEEFQNNKLIIEGVRLVFPTEISEETIHEWVKKGLRKTEIIALINNKL